ncbi:MAG: hypothetical protein QM757_27255 [Paludibaculum sp.]
MLLDQVQTFVRYQANIGEHAILKNPGADRVMISSSPTAPSISSC